MPTSNKNDAQSFSKLALIASAAATAAYVITQTRLLQRLAEPAPSTRVVSPPQPVTSRTDDATDHNEPVGHYTAGVSQTELPEARIADHPNDSSRSNGAAALAPPPASPSGRVRFRAARPARERLHYGLPVRHSRPRPVTVAEVPVREPAPVAVMETPVSSPPAFDGEEFNAEYLALVEAIACDGRDDEDEAEAEVEIERQLVAAASTHPTTAVAEMSWLPAPRLAYVLAALAYVGIAAAVGSDPVTLAADGVHALTTVSSTADLLLLGWVLCGAVVLIPLGVIVARLALLVTRGRLHLPAIISQDTAESAGWSLRLLAAAAFVAGAILYSPDALRWALNTDYPIAAVSSSSMAPTLDKGELVLIDGVTDIDELNIGDIIAFTHEQGIAVRRVVGFSSAGVLAQADAAPNDDLVIPFEDIAGRVLTLAGEQVKLPLLGNIAHLGTRTVEPGVSSSGQP